MSTDKHYFVEQTDDGRYAVRAKGSERASDILDTQREAIERVKELNPDDRPDVERVRNTNVGGRDKWRSSELISSWLHRIATANALSFGELIESVRGENLPKFTGVIDLDLPIAWRARLATFCRIWESRICDIDLQSQFPNRNLFWFTHMRTFHSSPGEPSIQLCRPFCVHCGEEQQELYRPAYIRGEWALAFRTHCPRHLSPLIDRCRSRLLSMGEVLAPCPKCGKTDWKYDYNGETLRADAHAVKSMGKGFLKHGNTTDRVMIHGLFNMLAPLAKMFLKTKELPPGRAMKCKLCGHRVAICPRCGGCHGLKRFAAPDEVYSCSKCGKDFSVW